ncbi:MAG: MFS transporter [Anaerolineae bacterium]|nr:MFS transporter [Anaerolineae bacterium]
MRPIFARSISAVGRFLTPKEIASRVVGRLRPPLLTTEDRNAWYLQVEVFWAAFLSVSAAFNAAFAVRLGATDTYIGWLSSLPALLAMVISLPAGRFLEGRRNPVPWTLNSLLLYRLGFVIVILVPWVVPKDQQGLVLVLVLVGMTIPAHFFNVGFNALLADVIPERKRAGVFTVRNVLNGIVLSTGTFLAGQWLSRAPFPFNYQMLYVVGLAGSLVSMYFLYRLRRPDNVPTIKPKPAQARGSGPGIKGRWRQARASLTQHADFIRFNVNTMAYSVAAWVVAPLYILFFVRELGASDAWIGLNGTLANGGVIFGWLLWRRIMGRWGESKTLKITVMLMGFYPLLVGISHNLTFILLAGVLINLIAPGISLSHYNTFLKVCPAEKRNTFMATYITIMNAGAFVCPFIGIALSRQFGLGPTLIGMGIFWFFGSSLFTLLPLRVPDTPR